MGMRGEWAGESIGPDVRETYQELILPGSVFAFLAEHRELLFPAVMFADMYPSSNRPAVHAAPGAGRRRGAAEPAWPVGLRDGPGTALRPAMDGRLRAGPATCGLDLLPTAFDPSLLTYFRRRLKRPASPDRLFSKDQEVVAATGVLRGKHRWALDSTVSEDAVATLGTVTQLKVSSAGIFAGQQVAPLHRQQTKNLLAGCWPRRAASPKRHLGRTPALPRGPTEVVGASRTPPRFADTG
ncbi:hypothetical protein [Streptomyces lydicus]